MSKMRRTYSKSKLFWGVGLIATALALLLNSLFGNIPVVSLLIAVLGASWMISEIVTGKLHNIFIPAAIIFIALQGHISRWLGHGGGNFISPWVVILAAILLQIGVTILMPKHKRWNIGFNNNTGNVDISNAAETSSETSSGEDYFENDMGASTCYVDASRLGTFRVTNDLGKLDVYIENPEQYPGNGTLVVNNDLGQMNIHIPQGWGVINNVSVDLGVVQCSAPQTGSQILTVTGSCDLGNVNIK